MTSRSWSQVLQTHRRNKATENNPPPPTHTHTHTHKTDNKGNLITISRVKTLSQTGLKGSPDP